jgi:hypothetical protein
MVNISGGRSNAGGPLDRDPPGLQCGDVTINRANRHLELFRKGSGRHRPSRGAQALDDVEQPIGAAHGG